MKISNVGLILAIIFVLLKSGIIIWMFLVPIQISQVAAKARRSVGAIRKILVPTIGVEYTERAVELACRLGQEQKAEIILTYIIEVVRTMPLDANLPRAEERAKEYLERAKSIVKLRGLRVKFHIERARESAEGIIRAAKDFGVDIIVLGFQPDFSEGFLSRTLEILLKNAPCEVIIDRVEKQ
ncbi:MAG: universal stress protein [Candidatus Firestonebacteria bacterium]